MFIHQSVFKYGCFYPSYNKLNMFKRRSRLYLYIGVFNCFVPVSNVFIIEYRLCRYRSVTWHDLLLQVNNLDIHRFFSVFYSVKVYFALSVKVCCE